MDIHQQLEEILAQINNELAPQDRITAQEIASVGHELNTLLTAATQQAAGQFQAPAPPRTLREKLAALWQAIKDKINAWLSPVSPRWNTFLNAVKSKLEQLRSILGHEHLVTLGLIAVGIALVAALLKSLPLLVSLLAILGFTSLLRMAERVTRFA